MTISTELMYAILSMDSYHQGYDSSLDHGQSQVGAATARRHQDFISDDEYQVWQNAGFYAAAYDYEGGIVISYRGTEAVLKRHHSADIVG